MYRMKKTLFVLVSCLCLMEPVWAAQSTVTIKYLGSTAAPGSVVSLYIDSDGTYPPYEISTDFTRAGYLLHDVSGSTGLGTEIDDPVWAFCIEAGQSPTYGSYATYDVIGVTGAANPTLPGRTLTSSQGALLEELWGRFHSTTMNSEEAAAFQLAIWEIVGETSGTYDIGSGSVRSDDLIGETNVMLDSLDGTGPMASLAVLTHPVYQDLLAEVPAPGAVSLGGLGMALLGWLRSRKQL
jgi:hypothetical protein